MKNTAVTTLDLKLTISLCVMPKKAEPQESQVQVASVRLPSPLLIAIF